MLLVGLLVAVLALVGITPVREMFITDAFHKTFITLDEEGTEAVAATAIIAGFTSAPQPATFTADHPFLFWIEHSSTGEMLFLGQVTNPAQVAPEIQAISASNPGS